MFSHAPLFANLLGRHISEERTGRVEHFSLGARALRPARSCRGSIVDTCSCLERNSLYDYLLIETRLSALLYDSESYFWFLTKMKIRPSIHDDAEDFYMRSAEWGISSGGGGKRGWRGRREDITTAGEGRVSCECPLDGLPASSCSIVLSICCNARRPPSWALRHPRTRLLRRQKRRPPRRQRPQQRLPLRPEWRCLPQRVVEARETHQLPPPAGRVCACNTRPPCTRPSTCTPRLARLITICSAADAPATLASDRGSQPAPSSTLGGGEGGGEGSCEGNDGGQAEPPEKLPDPFAVCTIVYRVGREAVGHVEHAGEGGRNQLVRRVPRRISPVKVERAAGSDAAVTRAARCPPAPRCR